MTETNEKDEKKARDKKKEGSDEESEEEDRGRTKEKDYASIRGIHIKDMPKPEKYDCALTEYQAWHDLFVALLTTVDEK